MHSFCYYGNIITTNRVSVEVFTYRINKVCSTFCFFEKIKISNHIPRNTRIRLFNNCIKSVVLCGYKTWNATTRKLLRDEIFSEKLIHTMISPYLLHLFIYGNSTIQSHRVSKLNQKPRTCKKIQMYFYKNQN